MIHFSFILGLSPVFSGFPSGSKLAKLQFQIEKALNSGAECEIPYGQLTVVELEDLSEVFSVIPDADNRVLKISKRTY